VFEMRVWKNEKEAQYYVAAKEKEIRDKDPKRYEHSLWSDVEGPFEVE